VHALKVAVAAGLALLLAACSSNEEPAYQEQPVDTLYTAAMEELLERNYIQAAQRFEEVERQHPYSIWAAKAQVMGAYAYFRQDQYDDAINAADRFIQLHPTSPDAPYAYYLKSLAYYEQIVDVGRDQRTTLNALNALEDVVRRFPETRYARDASLKLDLTRDHLAGKEMAVGRFYLKRGELAAAINRFKRVVEEHQTTSHVPEALLRLSEAYTALGLDNEARRMAAILGHNYPGETWYADAFELVEDTEVADFPREDERPFYERWWDPDSTIAKAERRELPNQLPVAPEAIQVAETGGADARAVERAPLGEGGAQAAGAVSSAKIVAGEDRSRRRRNAAARQAPKAPPKPTQAERAAIAAEAESQSLAAREAAGEWRRAAAAAASDAGRARAEANAKLGDAAVGYWDARGAVARAEGDAAESAAELSLAEASVAYWTAARDAAEDDLQVRLATEALQQAEEVLAYWRANGRRPGWLERIFSSAT